MEWGLIPVCSVQSGYEGFSGIRNIFIDNMEKAVETINNLQSVTEEQLKNGNKLIWLNWRIISTVTVFVGKF